MKAFFRLLLFAAATTAIISAVAITILTRRRMPPASPVEIVVPTGHANRIQSLFWSPDGALLASGSADATLKLWDPQTGALLRSIPGHDQPVDVAGWSADGSLIASNSAKNSIVIRNVNSGEPVRTVATDPAPIKELAWSPDLRFFAAVVNADGGKSYRHDTAVRVWRADTGAVVTTFGEFSDYLDAVVWSPDSRTLAAVGKPVKTWDAQTNAVRDFRPHQQVWLSQWVTFSPDGKLLAEWEGGTVRAWQSGSAEAAWKFHDNQGVGSIAWSPDSRRFATGTRTGVKLRDAATGALIQEFSGPKEYVSAMAWSPDARTLASGSWEGAMRLWDPNTPAPPRSLGVAPLPVQSVAWSPDGKTIASGGRDHAVRLWSVESGTQLSRLEGHSGDVISLSWSPDGRALASGSGDLTAKVWDPATSRPLHTLAVGKTGVRDGPVYGQPNGVLVAWSVDGRSLATTGDDDQQVKLWDPSTGRLQRKLETPNSSIWALSWSPDNRLLAAACGSIDLWDRDTGAVTHSDPMSHLVSRSLAFRPRGSTIANLESHGEWEMLSVASESRGVQLTRANRTSYPSDTRATAWSPDGRLLATAHDDGSVQLWDGDSGAALRNLSGHSGYVLSIAWSPDSRRLVSGGSDGTLRIHDASSGQTESVTTLLAEGEWITVLPNNRYYASSPHGDETASLRFAGSLRELVPLSLYRSELQRGDVRKLVGAPAPAVRPNFWFYAKLTAAALWGRALHR